MIKNWLLGLYTVLIFCSAAYADVNLLNLIKQEKAKFYVNPRCLDFLKNANRKIFQSEDIQKHIVPLWTLKQTGNYFYHYTNDKGGYLAQAIKKNSYASIFEYLFTYENFPSQVVGGGLYLADDPFSSREFGKKQFILNLDENARSISWKNWSVITSTIQYLYKNYRQTNSCSSSLLKSILLDENKIDIAFYQPTTKWYIVLNEEIIKFGINPNRRLDFMIKPFRRSERKLARSTQNRKFGYTLLQQGFVRDTKTSYIHGDRKFILQDYCSIDQSIKYFKTFPKEWTNEIKHNVTSYISQCPEPSFSILKSHVESFYQIDKSVFYATKFVTSSDAALNWLATEIIKNPALVSNWDAPTYLYHFERMIKEGSFTYADLVTYAPNIDTLKVYLKNPAYLSEFTRNLEDIEETFERLRPELIPK